MEFEQKKTTVPDPSVGADGGQSPVKDNTEIVTDSAAQSNLSDEEFQSMLRKMEEMNEPGYLRMVSLNDLLDTVYVGRRAIINDFLYTGAYLLAGAPKTGKSFLVAQLAYHVSTGAPFWGRPVHQGDVLYLALEDDERRLQSRMYRMYGVNGTDRLRFAIAAKQMGSGFDLQLEYALRKYPETNLVIIDTLQKIREACGDAYNYANDYQVIGLLKAFADQHGICILIVHHTRKQPSTDTFDMIAGTNGLLGAADGAMLLQKEKRRSIKATLDTVGRDQPEETFYLLKNPKTLIWEVERSESDMDKEPPEPLTAAIDALLTPDRPEWQGSATELVEALQMELQANALSRQLNVRAGTLRSEFNIKYENVHSRNGSRIRLTRMTPKA